MGRRYKAPAWEPEFNDAEVEGVDTAGKVFFETPQVITIGTARYQQGSGYQPSHRPPPSLAPNDIIADSPIRLPSSRRRSICPVDCQPATVIYELGLHPNQSELNSYLTICKAMGFNKGAIVARRYCSPWRRIQPSEWGLLTYLADTASHGSVEYRGPFNVAWFDNMRDPERAWAEDLILIHAALPSEILEQVIASQGVTA